MKKYKAKDPEPGIGQVVIVELDGQEVAATVINAYGCVNCIFVGKPECNVHSCNGVSWITEADYLVRRVLGEK